MDQMTDEELVAAYLHSEDREILETLIRRHLGRVRRLAYPMVLNHADADDVVQEVLVRVVQGLASFRGEATFSTWLGRVTMNTIYRFLARRNKAPRPSPCDMRCREAPGPAQPENAALHQELDAAVTRALEALPPELRAAIVWTTFDGVTPAEVAEIEGCTRATVYWRIHRARKALRRALRDWLE